MSLQIKMAGAWLAGGGGASMPQSLTFSGSEMQRDLSGLNWQHALTEHRGNRLEVLDFSVTREFDTPEACEAFCLLYAAGLVHPWEGAVDLYSRTPAGPWARWQLLNALIQPPEAGPPVGVSLSLRYRITGSRYTTTELLSDEEGNLITTEIGASIKLF